MKNIIVFKDNFLKNKFFTKSILKKAFIIFSCGLVFFAVSYAYLYFNLQKDTAKTDQKDYTVPYEKVPENKGIAFLLPDSSAILVYLDFGAGDIKLLEIENFDSNQGEYFGYTSDYTVQTDYNLIAGIIDRVGGVNIVIDGETLRYTGVQVIDLISEDYQGEIKRQLISQIFEQISKNNFSKDDFIYIIENSKSNLSIIDCIYWIDYIGEISGRINYVN